MPIIILLIINTVLLAILFMREMARRKETDRVERLVREEMSNNRKESAQGMDAFSKQLLILTQMNEQKLEKVRDVVETRLRMMQEDNSKKLEKMRETVDEKLHSTLEKRLGESFQMVSERLEKVHPVVSMATLSTKPTPFTLTDGGIAVSAAEYTAETTESKSGL